MTTRVDFTSPGFVRPLDAAEAFFFEHAGWSYDPKRETSEEGRTRHAIELAGVEREAKRRGWFSGWDIDTDPMWDDDVERESTDYDQYVAQLLDDAGEILASIGSVDLGPDAYPHRDPYMRVLGAELASEVLAR